MSFFTFFVFIWLESEKGDLTRQNESLSSTIDFLSGKKQELEEQIKKMED